jgi:hypothetical protein
MRFKKLIVATLAVCSAICMAPQTLNAQQTMNNDAVIKLVKAGLSEDLIISTINSQPGTYDTSTDGLIALKKSGVSDKVVDTLIKRSGNNTLQSSPTSSPRQTQQSNDDVNTSNNLLQQASNLDKQADDAAANAQVLEQKAKNSGTGFGAILSTKYSIQANQWRDKEREYRKQAQQLRAQAIANGGHQQGGQSGGASASASVDTAGDQPEVQTTGAATGYQTFDNDWCSFKYPADWKAYTSLAGVVISPEPQPVEHGQMNPHLPGYGAHFGALHIPTEGTGRNNQLTQLDFQALIIGLKQNDVQAGQLQAWGAQLTDATPMTINGRPAQAAEFTRFTYERSWVVAILPPGGGIGIGDWYNFYIEFLSPAEEFNARKPIFESIANSIIVKVIGQPKCGPGVPVNAYCHK